VIIDTEKMHKNRLINAKKEIMEQFKITMTKVNNDNIHLTKLVKFKNIKIEDLRQKLTKTSQEKMIKKSSELRLKNLTLIDDFLDERIIRQSRNLEKSENVIKEANKSFVNRTKTRFINLNIPLFLKDSLDYKLIENLGKEQDTENKKKKFSRDVLSYLKFLNHLYILTENCDLIEEIIMMRKFVKSDPEVVDHIRLQKKEVEEKFSVKELDKMFNNKNSDEDLEDSEFRKTVLSILTKHFIKPKNQHNEIFNNSELNKSRKT